MLAPTTGHGQGDALADDTTWRLSWSDDALNLPGNTLDLTFSRDDLGRPIVSFPEGGIFKPPIAPPVVSIQTDTTKSGRTTVAFTIGYERGNVQVAGTLSDDGETIEGTCTQGEQTVRCTMRRRRQQEQRR